MIDELVKQEFLVRYKKELLELQKYCQKLDQIELPLIHDFAPGIYNRRLLMPAGALIIGKTHKTEHFNTVLSGKATVMVNGEITQYQAGDVFVSKAGDKKVIHVLEDTVWMTTHATDETDLDKLEKKYVYSEEPEKKIIEEDFNKYELQKRGSICPG